MLLLTTTRNCHPPRPAARRRRSVCEGALRKDALSEPLRVTAQPRPRIRVDVTHPPDCEALPDAWFCEMNLWDALRTSCGVAEESFDKLERAAADAVAASKQAAKGHGHDGHDHDGQAAAKREKPPKHDLLIRPPPKRAKASPAAAATVTAPSTPLVSQQRTSRAQKTASYEGHHDPFGARGGAHGGAHGDGPVGVPTQPHTGGTDTLDADSEPASERSRPVGAPPGTPPGTLPLPDACGDHAAAATVKESEPQELFKPNCKPAAAKKDDDDMHDKHAAAAPRLPQQKPCNCKNSKCLKLYCDCFALNRFCLDECKCSACKNTSAHVAERGEAVKVLLDKNPHAFQAKIGKAKEHALGCRCKNSKCLKRYCECFAAAVLCGDKCTCIMCENHDGYNGSEMRAKRKAAIEPENHDGSGTGAKRRATQGNRSRCISAPQSLDTVPAAPSSTRTDEARNGGLDQRSSSIARSFAAVTPALDTKPPRATASAPLMVAAADAAPTTAAAPPTASLAEQAVSPPSPTASAAASSTPMTTASPVAARQQHRDGFALKITPGVGGSGAATSRPPAQFLPSAQQQYNEDVAAQADAAIASWKRGQLAAALSASSTGSIRSATSLASSTRTIVGLLCSANKTAAGASRW